jgi:site-specific recombinase XerD
MIRMEQASAEKVRSSMMRRIDPSRSRSRRVTAARAAAQRIKMIHAEQRREQALGFPPTASPEGTLSPYLAMTIDLAIQQFLHDQIGGNHSRKTIEWHQNALRLFQTYLFSACHLLSVTQITAAEVRDWLTWLRQTPGARGKMRTARTVETYARSARAFCNWLVKCAHLERTPFETVTFPKAGKPLIRLIEPEEFEQLLLACRPAGEIGPLVDRAAARNRAILWLLLDTGTRVSELCGLRLADLDRRRAILTVWGKGSKVREVPNVRVRPRRLLRS